MSFIANLCAMCGLLLDSAYQVSQKASPTRPSASHPAAMETLEGRVLLSGLPAFQNLGVGGGGGMFQVTVSPYNSQYVHIACDMSGDYRSLNGGGNWEMISYKQIDSSRGLRPAFSATRTYWVDQGEGNGDVRYSADQGLTWTKLLPGSAPWPDAVAQLAAISGTPDKVFVGTASGLWQSQDGGVTWTQASTGSCTSIITIGSRVYATLGSSLKRSLDGGLTWSSITVTGAGTHTLKKVAGAQVGTAEPYLFVIADQVGIIRSTDGGTTWSTVQAWNLQSDILMPQGQTQKIYACQEGVDSGLVWASTNGGSTWTSIFKMSGTGANVTNTWVQTQLHWGYYVTTGGLGAAPSDPNILFLATQGELYKSTNGGATWAGAMAVDLSGNRHQSIGLEVTSCWDYKFDPTDHNRQYICYTDVGFARSTDGGATFAWSNSGNPWSNTMYEVAFDPTVAGKMYGAASQLHDIPEWNSVAYSTSSSGGAVVSSDYGATWSVLGTGLPAEPCTDILVDPTSPPSARVLYATMYSSGVWKSTDGGATWVNKPGVGFTTNKHAYHLVRDGATGTLYCLVTGMRSGSTFTPRGGVWRSSNGGDTWQEITGARFAWPTDVAVADANTIYVSVSAAPGFSQDGVWKTTNGGINWTQVLTGSQMGYWHTPGYTHALTVKVHPDNPNIVYCGTVDHGLWVSTDAGTTWNPFSNIPFQAPTNVAFDPLDRTKIYVTTFGGGVWKGYYLPLLPGDANSDGKVSFADYLLLEGNFGRTGTTWAQGDFNADGKVSFADYLILESSFGQSVTSPAPVSSMTATAPPAATAAPAPLSAGTAVRVTAGSAEQARRFVVSSPSALAAAARQAKPLASAGIQSSLSESRLASTVRRSLRSDL